MLLMFTSLVLAPCIGVGVFLLIVSLTFNLAYRCANVKNAALFRCVCGTAVQAT